jgi:1,4-dihydroxy-2-naphthoate octaprenyltransferase
MIKNYIKAARLRTLPLSVSGIIIGSFLGNEFYNYQPTILNSPIFWLAIFTTIGFQVLSNFANDYGDGIKGTDDHRKGEARMVASGAISPKQMKFAMIITTFVTLMIALFLIYISLERKILGIRYCFSC